MYVKLWRVYVIILLVFVELITSRKIPTPFILYTRDLNYRYYEENRI